MAFATIAPATPGVSLNHLLTILQKRGEVRGIALLGSTAGDALTATSDIDLLVVVGGSVMARSPFEVAFTYLDGRPSDVILTTVDEVARLRAADWNVPLPAREESMLRWIREGRIVYDPVGVLRDVAAKPDPPVPWTDAEQRVAWWSANFALAKATRYLRSTEPDHWRAARWVLYGGFHPALVGYFAARNLPWAGEKEGIAYLRRADPAMLASLEAFLTATDEGTLLDAFARIVRHALDPIGGVWPKGAGPLSERWETLVNGLEAT